MIITLILIIGTESADRDDSNFEDDLKVSGFYKSHILNFYRRIMYSRLAHAWVSLINGLENGSEQWNGL